MRQQQYVVCKASTQSQQSSVNGGMLSYEPLSMIVIKILVLTPAAVAEQVDK